MTLSRRFMARSLSIALALGLCAPLTVAAQPSQAPISVPTPAPMPTISGTPLPYPAYGSPAPDVAAQRQKPGVPLTVTLNQAIDIAAAQSPTFASDRAVYNEIAAKYGSEKSALLPGVSGTVSATKSYGTLAAGVTSPSATALPAVQTEESATLDIQQLIFDGGRTIAGIRSAKEADIAGYSTLLRQLQTLAFTVATNFYTLLEDNATVQSDAALVREFEINEQFVTAQIRTGAAPRSDLAAAQFQTAQARGALVTAQGALIAAQATFSTSLGLDADTAIMPQALGTSPAQARLLSYQQALHEAFNLRPDFLAAEHTVESDKENLRFAKLARFPSIEANGSVGHERNLVSTSAVTIPYSNPDSLGATLSIPIFDQGVTNFNIASAASQLDQGIAALTLQRLTVQSDVRGGLANLISARANLVQAQAAVTSAQVSLQATQAQYRVGASTITAIVTAEANLATAQTTYVAALYGERLAESQYYYALGANDLSLQ
jgi:outer membrane protein